MPNYWLMKSEPSVYSIDDLERDRTTCWEGVRNYQARNFMRDRMRVGDHVLFYHSNADPPGVAGIARIAREGYADRYSWDPGSRYFDEKSTPDSPRWYMVDLRFVKKLKQFVPLEVLKTTSGLENMLVNKRSRLSVQPATRGEFEIVKKLGGVA